MGDTTDIHKLEILAYKKIRKAFSMQSVSWDIILNRERIINKVKEEFHITKKERVHLKSDLSHCLGGKSSQNLEIDNGSILVKVLLNKQKQSNLVSYDKKLTISRRMKKLEPPSSSIQKIVCNKIPISLLFSADQKNKILTPDNQLKFVIQKLNLTDSKEIYNQLEKWEQYYIEVLKIMSIILCKKKFVQNRTGLDLTRSRLSRIKLRRIVKSLSDPNFVCI